MIQDIAIASNEASSVDSAFQYTLDRLCQHLEWPLGHALLAVDEETLIQTSIWSSSFPARFSAFRASTETLKFKSGYGLPGMVLSSKQPVWLTNIPENPLFGRKAAAREAGLRTGLAVPILAGKDVVGVMEFFHDKVVPPDPTLLAVLPHLGVQLGRVVERENAQQALRKSAAQLKMVVTSLPVILWVIDREGRIILLEGKGAKAAGLNDQELLGRSIFETLTQRPDLMNQFHRAMKGEEIHTEVTGGNGIVYEVFHTPYLAPDGSVEAVIGLALDVSERKRMEHDLEEMRRRLMESVDTERARLAQQLHDGPLQDLYGAFYQIQEIKNNLDEPGQEVAGRALKTIQSVNSTLRIICGELRPTTLVHLGLQKAIQSHAEMLQDYQNEMLVHLDLAEDIEEGGHTLPHPLRLGLFRIYQQLINNIVRHSKARHCWVRLRILPDQVLLEVQDNGVGFVLPEQWIEFVRGGQFGLASVQERVERMQGKMDIQTEPGHGTLVRVSAPR